MPAFYSNLPIINMLLLISLVQLSLAYEVELLHKFTWLNFTFETKDEYNQYFKNKHYEDCTLAGIKMNSKGEIFVSVPRWKSNVPATLNKIVKKYGNTLLQPFPSWNQNKIGDIDALQSVLGFEIDKDDNVWVLDQGKVDNQAAVNGTMKLVKYNSSGNQELKIELDKVACPVTSFLNDLVIDTEKEFVYISDSGNPLNTSQPLSAWNPAIIVVDVKNKAARRVLQQHHSTNPDPGVWVVINGERVGSASPIEAGIDGIALSCDGSYFYYTPLTSRTLYAIETSYLRDFNSSNLEKHVIEMGFKSSTSDGLAMTAKNNLCMTATEKDGIYMHSDIKPDPEKFFYQNFELIANNSTSMIWPDTIGFDNTGKKLLFVSNKLNEFYYGRMDFSKGQENFHIWSVDIDDRSYIYGCDESNDDSSDSLLANIQVVVSLLIS